MTEFTYGIAAGPDGNLWFTESRCSSIASVGGGAIGRITTNGTITEFALPTSNSPSGPYGIAGGPDGNLWFTECGCLDNVGNLIGGNKIGRITP